jgi:hypothetical protein
MENELETALEWIGFANPEHRARLLGEVGPDLSTFLRFTEKEISSVQKEMAENRTAALRITFGLARTKFLKSMIHWAQDFNRVNATPSLDGLDRESFLAALIVAEQRARIRAQMTAICETRAKEASPGKLKSEKQWNTWEQALCTQLGILLGVNGVPLVYVIREKEAEPGATYDTFFEESVAKARLEGPEFEADSLQVHQIIRALTVGENAEQWIRELARYKDGRRDMIALRAHFRGEGNTTRQISMAEQMYSVLHYKDERSMPFSDYISKVKEMFNIYFECNEAFSETRKLRFLWGSIKATTLQPAIESLKAQLAVDPDSWTFVSAANHLASQIAPLPKGRQLSEVRSGDGGGSSAKGIPVDRNGNLKLHGYSAQAWGQLSRENKNRIFEERQKQGKGSKSPKGRRSGPKLTRNAQAKKMDELAKALKQQKKIVAALSGKKRADYSTDDSSSASNTSTADDAGNSFGGRDGKKNSKNNGPKKAKNT